MIDNRLFAKHAGRIWVRIGEQVVEVFGKNWILLDFILMAWKNLTGEDRRIWKGFGEERRWKIIRTYFNGSEGVVEVKRLEA